MSAKADKSATVEKATQVNKATYNDIRGYLSDALKAKFKSWLWVRDHDASFVYFEQEVYSDNTYARKDYKMAYTADGVNVILTGEATEVKLESVYTEVVDSTPITEKSLTKSITEALKGLFKIEPTTNRESVVIKQFDDEEMVAIEPMYVAPNQVDAHGETATAKTLKGMVDSFNKANADGRLKTVIDHKTVVDDFHPVHAWINPCPCTIGETDIPEGQPVIKLQFTDKDAWEKRKSGKWLGPSIGGRKTGTKEVEVED